MRPLQSTQSQAGGDTKCPVPLRTPAPPSTLRLLHPLRFRALAAVSGQVEGHARQAMLPMMPPPPRMPDLSSNCVQGESLAVCLDWS